MIIFEIEKNLLEVIDLLEQNGGEMTDEVNEILNVNRNEIEIKLSQYRHIIMKVQSEIQTGNDEIKRIQNMIARKNKALESLAMYSQKAIELYGLEISTSKAKNKPKQVKLKNDVRAILSFTENVELAETINNKSTLNFPEELIPYSKLQYSLKLTLEEYNKISELVDIFETSVLENNIDIKSNVEISTNKTDVKKAIGEGIEFENVKININPKIEFK